MSFVDNVLYYLCIMENVLFDVFIYMFIVLLIGVLWGFGYVMVVEFLKNGWNVVGMVCVGSS